MDRPVASHLHERENVRWVQTRMMLDDQLMQAVRYGFSLIAVGFGSFAFLEGGGGRSGEATLDLTPSRAFSLAATGLSIAILLVAIRHTRIMVAWVNTVEFPDGNVPPLPEERLPEILATLAILVGVCAFIAILLLRQGPASS